jgi:hypothetical protein
MLATTYGRKLKDKAMILINNRNDFREVIGIWKGQAEQAAAKARTKRDEVFERGQIAAYQSTLDVLDDWDKHKPELGKAQ